jgi:polysaccharide biosynthesis protein PelA
MKKYWIVATILIGLTIMISSSIFAHYQGQSPLSHVRNFKIYYGEVDQNILKSLSNYDLAIIEPHEFTKEQITQLKGSDTITLGYISIMELEKWNKSFVEKVQETDYYYQNKEKIYIEKWDTYIMNISNPHYRQIILEEIQDEIFAKGLEGIFLDTAGDIDDFFYDKPKELQKLRTGYTTLLQDIKKQNEELILLQNWGFETYKQTSNPYIDGILWENFNQSKLEKSKWGQNWINYFKNKETDGDLAVFTVSPNDSGKNFSEKNGFTSYTNENSIYNDWFE